MEEEFRFTKMVPNKQREEAVINDDDEIFDDYMDFNTKTNVKEATKTIKATQEMAEKNLLLNIDKTENDKAWDDLISRIKEIKSI